MTEEQATTKAKGDLQEFFAIRDLDEAEVYFTKLPSEHRWLLVDKLVTSAIESKEADAQLVGDFFSRAVSKSLCSPDHFEKGFTSTVEILDDIAIDAPKAYSLMTMMMNGAQLNKQQWLRLSSKVKDPMRLVHFHQPRAAQMNPQQSTLVSMVFELHNLGEAERIVRELPQQQRWTAVDTLVKEVLDSRAEDVDFVAELFSWLASREICPSDAFEEGFTASADVLFKTMKSMPEAKYLMAMMQKGARLSGAQRIRLAGRALQGQSLALAHNRRY
ncbi:armadillo-type protein [Fomitopsis betulina]|nr:armadillo-type protein [Fomitopsis betulina]